MGLNKIIKLKRGILNLHKTIYYNFKYLPFKSALKMPIIVFKGTIKGKGSIRISAPCKFGMIKLGFNTIPLLPNNGIKVLNDGLLHFRGKCNIGNSSVISISKNGELELGNNTCASAGLQVVCHNRIVIHDNVLIGWGCTLMDTDLHKIKYLDGGQSKGYGNIIINENCWLANSCKVYKNSNIAKNCIVAADTIITKLTDCKPNTLISNDHSIRIIRENVFHDWNDDKIIIKR